METFTLTGVILIIVIFCYLIFKIVSQVVLVKQIKTSGLDAWNYKLMKIFIRENDISLPAMFVNLDVLNQNIDAIIHTTLNTGKTIRVVTKSIRNVDILKHIFERCQETGVRQVFQGLMCYSVKEAHYLSQNGFDDFFIPYPTLQEDDISVAMKMAMERKTVCLTVDSEMCVESLSNMVSNVCNKLNLQYEQAQMPQKKLLVAIDMDMSYSIYSSWKLGPHRSRLTVSSCRQLITRIQESKFLELRGALCYEAHVAGLPELSPSRFPSLILYYMKTLFNKETERLRHDAFKEISRVFDENKPFFVNGGGSGNYKQALQDLSLTEVAVGSAFLQGHLFDNYVENTNLTAMCFALQVTRIQAKENYICCQSGGFIASGGVSSDKSPLPFANPTKLEPFSDEGYGEVQTPLYTKNAHLYNLGDPVFFRPAKSGEIAEQFNEYILKRTIAFVSRAKTYRGEGKRFF